MKIPAKLPIRVYLANSYSSKIEDPDDARMQELIRRHLEAYTGGRLRKKFKGKYCFLLPIALSASMADICAFDTGFKEWASEDYSWIDGCHETWVLLSDGWRESVGVQAEIVFSHKTGKPVKYIDPDTLEFIDEDKANDLY